MTIKSDIERAINIAETTKNQHLKMAQDLKEYEIMFLTHTRIANDFEKAEQALRKCLMWCK